MGKLPDLPHTGGFRRGVLQNFSGYRHTEAAFDGAIYDMENLCSDGFPMAATRRRRRKVQEVYPLDGFFTVEGHIITAENGLLCKNGDIVGVVSETPKTFAVLGHRLIIFPDKVYLNYAAKSTFVTLADLQISVTDAKYGDVYAVGVGTPYDLYYWNGSDWAFYEKEFGLLESSFKTRVTFPAEGELYGEKSLQNSLVGFNGSWKNRFSVGDAVTISGCTDHPENNITAVIRGIDGDTLQFYEYLFTTDTVHRHEVAEELPAADYCFIVDGVALCFRAEAAIPADDVLTWNGTALTSEKGVTLRILDGADPEETEALTFTAAPQDYTESSPVTVSRTVPDMDFLCSANNRLWGCVGDTIYSSKLGDPFNFNVFDGLSTDSWSVNSGSPGDFTACCAYLGYPLFFKEDRIYKVYGSRPAEFQLVESMTMGVAKGSEKSLAVAEEMLFYLSPSGVVCYSGGVPAGLSAPFGSLRFHEGIAASAGSKYYISMADSDGRRHLFVYDALQNLWHREDSLAITAMAKAPQGIYLVTDSAIWQTEGTEGEEEAELPWFAEFGPFLQNSPDSKTIGRLTLRLKLGENSSFRAEAAFDDGPWLPCGKAQTKGGLRSVTLPVVPRRCDHFRLRLSGEGECYVQGMMVEYTVL